MFKMIYTNDMKTSVTPVDKASSIHNVLMVATILRSHDQVKTTQFILVTHRYINLINTCITHDCEWGISTAALKTENTASTLIDVNIKSNITVISARKHKQKYILK